jgi:hypothetical protein
MTTIVVQPGATEATYQITVEINDTTYQVGATFGAGPQGPQGEPGAKGDKGDTGPAGLNWRMGWDAGTQYAVDDAVYYNGSSYYAVAVPTVGTAPDPNLTTPWMELAIMGQKGDKGDTGATGPAGVGVPDMSGATSGDVVRYNGSTTEWHTPVAADITDLGTAATKNTGTTSGTVPLLNASGRLDIARLASGTPDGTKYIRDDGTLAVVSPTLTKLSGTLAADATLGTSLGTVLTCSGFTAGTWLVTATITVAASISSVIYAEFQAVAGTGAPTLAGATAGGVAVSSSSAREVQAVLTFFVTCTAASTVTIQGISSGGTPGPVVKASTVNSALVNATGWTAIKIA